MAPNELKSSIPEFKITHSQYFVILFQWRRALAAIAPHLLKEKVIFCNCDKKVRNIGKFH
jgi:hypothetical protein